MKAKFIAIAILFACSQQLKAQLFSSGNTVITGNNIGIGTNAPATPLHILGNTSSSEMLRIAGTNPTGVTRFTILNDAGFGSRATFTRYGTAFPGGYPGMVTQFPYPNLLAFGCNVGSFLISTNGKLGLSVVNGGTSKLRFFIDSTLRTGIGGNSHPVSDIHFNNSDNTSDSLLITNNTTGHTATDGLIFGNSGNNAFLWNRENANLTFGTGNASRLIIAANGMVSIGSVTTPAGYKLYVEQGILTEKVKVAVKTSSDWSDYVFAPQYKLKPLSEVATYIKQHQHLENIPSANEVVNNGIDLASMDAKLLAKIEELTLYMIELNKKNEELQQRVNTLELEKK
jgi:trimeric autotransporter adhesin